MSGKSQPPPPSANADPSMEDILASIRRILSEDEQPDAAAAAHPAPPEPAAPPPAAAPVEDDILDLDASMLVMESPASATEIAEPPLAAQHDFDALTLPPPSQSPPPPAALAPAPRPAEPEPWPPMSIDEGLVAPAAAAAPASSVGALMRTLAAERATAVHRGGPTIEDLVREEIRPLLKDWLDTHLPRLVERLVRTEIERVVGRALH